MQLERVGRDFHGGLVFVERHVVTQAGRSREAAENAAGGAHADVTASGEEANLIVSVEPHCRKHVYLDRELVTAVRSLETGRWFSRPWARRPRPRRARPRILGQRVSTLTTLNCLST